MGNIIINNGAASGGNGGNNGSGRGGAGGGGATAGNNLIVKDGIGAKVEVVGNAKTEVTLPDPAKTVNAVLTQDEKNDKTITDVKVTLKVDDKTATKPDQALIEAKKPANSVIGAFFDITLQKTITKNNVAGNPESVTDVPNGAVTITIPAGKAQNNNSGRIYWPLSKLAELYAGVAEDTVLKLVGGTNPETGGPGKYIPVTGGGELITLEAPSPKIENTQTIAPTQPKTITPSDAGFEKDAFAGTPDNPQSTNVAVWIGMALILGAASIAGVIWLRKNSQHQD